MIYFFADNHFGTRAGACWNDILQGRYPIAFFEDTWSGFLEPAFMERCDLLMLHCIGGTGPAPAPGSDIEAVVHAYVESGRPLLLLHGANAAFSNWPWWRSLTGFRWVRANDPDGARPSTHPIAPCRLEPAAPDHPLGRKLTPLELPTDEIYIDLQQTGPATVLMTTRIGDRLHPQLWETTTTHGGIITCFVPGHLPEVIRLAPMLQTITTLIEYLRNPVKPPALSNASHES